MAKIVLITPYWQPIKGGITTYTTNLFTELKKKFECFVIIKEGNASKKNEILINTNKIIFIWKSFKKLSKIRPDIVHVHGHWYMNLAAVMYKRFTNKKAVLVNTEHTLRSSSLKGLKKWVYIKIMDNIDYNVFVSKKLLESFSNFPLKSKKRVIYPGIRMHTPKVIKETKYALLAINNFSHKEKTRGTIIFLRSIKNLSTRYPEIRTTIIGNGKYREDAIKECQNLRLKNVTFVDSTVDVNKYLSKSQIFVHVSFQDSFGLVVLEALGMKKPVVISNNIGASEILQNNKTGIIVEPKKAKIVNAISNLFDDPRKMKRIGSEGYNLVKKRYNWKNVLKEYMEIYGVR